MNIRNIETPITLQQCDLLSLEEKEKVSEILKIHKIEILRSVAKEIKDGYAPIQRQFNAEKVELDLSINLLDSLYNDFVSPQTSMAFERNNNENANPNAT